MGQEDFDDDVLNQIEETNRRKKLMENATEAKKMQYINEIKDNGDKIKKDPARVEFIPVPWYKKLGRALKKFFTEL